MVAERLSEDPGIAVAVIEAGPHYVNEPRVDTPLAGRVLSRLLVAITYAHTQIAGAGRHSSWIVAYR